MGQPLQALADVLAHCRPPRQVEGAAADQGLATAGHRHEPRRHRLGQALDLDRLGAAGHVLGWVVGQVDLAQVDADPAGELDAGLGEEIAQALVEGEGEEHRVQGPLEEHQEAVGLVDLEAVTRRKQVAGESVVMLEDLGRTSVAEALHQGRAADQVADQEGRESALRGGPRIGCALAGLD